MGRASVFSPALKNPRTEEVGQVRKFLFVQSCIKQLRYRPIKPRPTLHFSFHSVWSSSATIASRLRFDSSFPASCLRWQTIFLRPDSAIYSNNRHLTVSVSFANILHYFFCFLFSMMDCTIRNIVGVILYRIFIKLALSFLFSCKSIHNRVAKSIRYFFSRPLNQLGSNLNFFTKFLVTYCLILI